MNKKLLIFFIVALFVLGAGVFLLYSYFSKNSECASKPCIGVNGHFFRIEVADTIAKRTEGLSGREGLAEDEGMLFVFDSPMRYGFWMKGVKFPIDIIWIKDNKVVDLSENIQPEAGKPDSELKIYNPHEPVNKVLELRAGTVKKYGFRSGDSVEVSL